MQIEQATRNGELARASELQYGKLPELERRLKAEEELMSGNRGANPLLKEEVDEEDIAEVVSRWTHIPVTRLLEGEVQKLLRLPDELQKRVVGQGEAVDAVAAAVIRARSGLKDPNRPSARSSSWARPAWARPNWPALSPSFCSTTSGR